MTALLVMNGVGWRCDDISRRVARKRHESGPEGRERVRVAEMLAAAVIGSANDAAPPWPRMLTDGRQVRPAHERAAAALGMRNTRS
jgi:D-alanyl-D-alanine carboxypeptidase